MVSDELKSIIDKLKEQGKMNFLKAVTDEQIETFEKEHNIKFPSQYREWLTFSDGGEFFIPAGMQLRSYS
ncbi:SMI1/KNR4 family protein [Lactobacillus sp. ESL0236]|uniref:SMI1/KNR4 family protein n=1 Tax=unclassified Lactobacillus TaxID=2620435 RepID=UPI000EFA8DD4|nr:MULTISPECIES: SMI1/KNR4 family protein [unclassified Lactobacillus]RMC38538.1 SMI1/KNR4 family protein [Lactobacillus sp. ESL0237]RMC42883.1 SMI1/KNR4 family protein [Lactobacillus sp. ESL0234]RMC43737.1 SMI1/KNR4 family protein [Lactobacillus sp. ESL0236]